MSHPTRVLITALSGDMGQAILKALRLSSRPVWCAGADLEERGIGAAFTDAFDALPPANDERYVPALDDVCRRLRIEVVIPAHEAEQRKLAAACHSRRLPSGAAILMQPESWVSVYGDKLRCMQALAPFVPLAPFADAADDEAVGRLVEAAGFPLIVKSRTSSGSRGIRAAASPSELAAARAALPGAVVQAYLDDSAGEFSVGVFANGSDIRTLAFKRSLGPVGCTWHAETSELGAVHDYARSIARVSGMLGAANVQVRATTAGIRLLEINARFSSLVAARAYCGFRDVEWSMAMLLEETVPEAPPAYRHIRFRRFFHELVDDGQGFEAVAEWQPRVASERLA